MAHLATGTMLAGYRIERFLGKGGMGVVYLASQVSLDRPIALKLIAPERALDPGFRERFLRESRVAASIDHPHVVPVHEAGEDHGVLYVAMRYVEGADLAALLRADGPLEPARAARIVAQVADALDAAHARGLVHRDVKPANVLVADPGGAEHCYLTDFGLTKQTAAADASATQTGTVMGTAHYIAPEQLRGDAVDARTDVYSLGCVLFELLSGRPPFVRDTDVATLFAHLSESPPALGGPFDDVIERAMEKDPAQRFQSAGDLGRAALLAGEGPPTEAAPAQPKPRRRPRRAVLAAAAVALVLAGLTAALALTRGGGDLHETRSVDLGGIPLSISGLGGRLFITLESEPGLAVLDPRSGAVTHSPSYGTQLSTTAGRGGTLFVGDYGRDPEDGKGAIVAVDAANGRKLWRADTIEPYQLVAGPNSVWITDRGDTVQRLDVGTHAADPPIQLEATFDLALAAGRVWVLLNRSGQLLPFDERTGERAGRPIRVGARPLSAAAVADVIWVVTEPGRLVRAVAGQTRTTEDPIGPPDPLFAVSADRNGVWVVDGLGNVKRADPADPARQQVAKIGRDVLDAEPDATGAWVLHATAGDVSSAVRVSSR